MSGKELVIPLQGRADLEDHEDDTNEQLVVQKALAAKDRFIVSDEAYHELRIAQPHTVRDQLPSLNKLTKERHVENTELDIIPISQVIYNFGVSEWGGGGV